MLTLSLSLSNTAYTGNPIVIRVLAEQAAGTPYTPLTVPAQHSVELDIEIETVFGSNTLTLLGTVVSRVSDASYYFVFDIAATLHAWFQDYFKGQNPVQDTVTFNPSVIRRYKLTFREKGGATTIDTHVGTFKNAYYGVNDLDYIFGFDNNSCWLSAHPLRRWANLSEPYFVSFYNYTGDVFEFSPRLKLYGGDGLLMTTVSETGISIPIPFPSVTLAAGEVVTFNLGNLGFGLTYPLSIVRKMEFEPNANGGTTYAQPLTLYNDAFEPETQRTLLYRNRYGVIETLRCTGGFNSDKETTRYESVSAGDSANIAEYYGHRRQYDADVTTVLTFRTGYIDKAEKAALSDMFIINDVWWWTNNKYIPLRLLDNKFEVFDTFEDLSSVTIRVATRNVGKI